MLALRRSRRCLVLLTTFVLGACNGTAVVPSASQAQAATPVGSPRTSAAASPASPTVAPTASASARLQIDGQIVFEDSGVDFEHTQIWLENADGSDVRKLVTDEFTDFSASLSPDGTKVLFYRAGALMVVNVDGSGLHEIQTAAYAKQCDVAPEGDAWSPNGRRIAFVKLCFDASGTYLEGGVWTMKADGTDIREATKNRGFAEDHRAGWSPDGKQLVFQRIDISETPEQTAIFTVGVDGRDLRQVTPWALNANDPDWSPDGKLIAFNASAEPSPTQNIYTIHPDGSGLTKLTTYDQDGQATFHPSWSPDGTRILFSHSPSTDGWGDFYVMDRDGGNQQVIARTALHENHGSWGRSPSP